MILFLVSAVFGALQVGVSYTFFLPKVLPTTRTAFDLISQILILRTLWDLTEHFNSFQDGANRTNDDNYDKNFMIKPSLGS